MITYKRLFIALMLSLAITKPSIAGPVELFYQRELTQQNQTLLLSKTPIETKWFTQPIDKGAPSKGTFEQRYYIDETYGTSDDAPIFLYICGEAACSKKALMGMIRNHAEKFNAKLIALEHRYYGESMPYSDLSTKHLENLSTFDALFDIEQFQKTLVNNHHWTGKWVVFGGSYPGSLAAYSRLILQDNIAGAIASSAPVMPKADFFEYDAHVANVVGPECAEHMREVVNEIEQALSNTNKQRYVDIQEQFNARDIINPTDFLYMVADIGAGAVQYGEHLELCKMLSGEDSPIEGYSKFAKQLLSRWHIRAVDLTPQSAMSESIKDHSNGIGFRQWYYQSCTEYGYWQNANADRYLSTRSTSINTEYHLGVCQRLFGTNLPTHEDLIYHLLYLPLMEPLASNIHFTNGSNDPWSILSFTPNSDKAINDRMTYTLIDNAAHCDDLRGPKLSDTEALKQARNKTELLISGWLAVKT